MDKAKITGLDPLQITTDAGETYEEMHVYTHYGFASSPPLGTPALVDENTILATKSAKITKPGEALLYAGEKAEMRLSPDGKMKIQAGNVEILTLISELLQELTILKTTSGAISADSSAKFTAMKTKLDGTLYGP